MTHAYPRARYLVGVVGRDVVLVAAMAMLLLTERGPVGAALAAGIVTVLGWGIATIHFPSSVEHTGEAITFRGYGRAHTFAWSEVERLSVRRFLVRDRVLVRLSPASAWRGRYWILRSIDGFDELVSELERRAAALRS